MKNFIKAISGFFFLLIISCSPQINYLGDSYTPTKEIDIFFDENDIEKEFKVMGVMKNEGDEFEVDDAESVKEAMVKKAKAVGADAILFVGFYSDRVTNDHSNIDNVKKIYEAKLLKYR